MSCKITFFFDYPQKSPYKNAESRGQYQNDTLTITSPSGIGTVRYDHPVDVYTLQGTRVRRQVTTLRGLPRGVYIVEGKSVVVR